MSKKYGLISEFCLVRRDVSRTVIGYGLTPDDDQEHATWHEAVIYRKKIAQPTMEQAREAVEADINAQTDERILTGFVWTPEGGEPVSVWLSMENQSNYSEAYHIAERKPEAILPVTFKLGERADRTPVYHTFETFAELESFYLSGAAFKNRCLNEGWQRKDAIDWQPYDEALANPVVDDLPAPEPSPDVEPEPESEPEPSDDSSSAAEPAGNTSGSDPSVSEPSDSPSDAAESE